MTDAFFASSLVYNVCKEQQVRGVTVSQRKSVYIHTFKQEGKVACICEKYKGSNNNELILLNTMEPQLSRPHLFRFSVNRTIYENDCSIRVMTVLLGLLIILNVLFAILRLLVYSSEIQTFQTYGPPLVPRGLDS